MKRKFITTGATALALAAVLAIAAAASGTFGGGTNADLPPRVAQDPDATANYLQLRDAYESRIRGIEPGHFFDPTWRQEAVATRFRQERTEGRSATAWTEIGPDSLPNGQTQQFPATAAVSGRVTAIAIDPTNSSKAYLGTAQGGVWRTLNGDATWTPIFDSAQSLSIGALALAPSNPTILYVGTGEPNLSVDSFFGVGIYRIDNADTSATLLGPINPPFTFTVASTGNPLTTTTFGGRSISRILVHPTDPATIFVATTTGVGGAGGNSLSGFIPPLALVGVYRSTNATSAPAAVTFQKLAVATAGGSLDTPPTGNRRIQDLTFVNNDPNTLLASTFGNPVANDGGIFRSTNALAATPSFTQTFTGQVTRILFAHGEGGSANADGNTILAATSESPGLPSGNQGRLRESLDGGVTWPTILTAADGFCGGQCFYDLPVGIDPTSHAPTLRIYLGGNARGTNSDVMKLSNDGGATFTRDDNGLHADAHAITFDSSTPANVWFGNDGGVWKRDASLAPNSPWTNLNTGLGTLQFQSVAVGKSDPFFTLGGTQDNGTELQQTGLGNWTSAESGDGGYALIDQSTTSTSSVTAYHTFFNQANSLIGFDRTSTPATCPKDGWAFRGFGGGTDPTPSCDGASFAAANGIVGTDSVVFYAPMALGPGTPNTLYFGTSRLYRSTDRGDTMTTVSQIPISGSANSPITTIAISPQDDNYRLVGLQNGQVWATTTGSSTLTNVTSPSFPANATGSTTNKWVGRAAIDPNDKNTAYVTFSYYASGGAGLNVWKTTNLNAATPTWAAAASGIPNVPVNAFAIDPNNSSHLFAGTDVGVYASTDGGTTWAPLGTGLPAVAVFDMAIVQPRTATEKLRVATHGRSMWQIDLTSVPTAVTASSFRASRHGTSARLSWRTSSEATVAGFGVFRNGVKANGRLIAAKRAGQTRGASYTFLDRHAARGAVYRLQLVDLRGRRTWFAGSTSVR